MGESNMVPEPSRAESPDAESMFERVTRAITEKLNSDLAWMSDTSILTRAAFEAMREPTEAMIRVGRQRQATADLHTAPTEDSIYRAMIDAALAGGDQ